MSEAPLKTEFRERAFASWMWIAVALLTLGSLGVLACPAIPLGVHGEWMWARRTLGDLDPNALLGSLVLAATYGFWASGRERKIAQFAWTGPGDPRRIAQFETWIIASQCAAAFLWMAGYLFIQPEFQGITRSPAVLFYTRTEGYFHQAAYEVPDSREFLSGYHDSIASGDDPDRYLHLGTHPPGLTLAYRTLLVGFERYPRVADALIAVEPTLFREGINELRRFPTPRGQLMTAAEEATLWAATLLTLFAVAAACWPIYRLTLRMSDRVTAWRAAALWPLVPSLFVFFPKSDLLCPVIGVTSCWLWLDGWSRLRWGRCVLAGMGFFAGLMLTLALAPVALLLVIQTCLERWTRREEFRDRRVAADVGAVCTAVVGCLIPLGIVCAWGQCNLFAIWLQNLSNHALFYAHNERSFGAWLVVNPLEAAFALGVPLACLVVSGAIGAVRHRLLRPLAFSHMVAWGAVWAILWLSGKNMGEAARLWIFLAPWPVMAAALGLMPRRNASGVPSPQAELEGESDRSRAWRLLLILQLVACLWTAFMVDGFHFAELIVVE